MRTRSLPLFAVAILSLWPSAGLAQEGLITITIERAEGVEPETRWNAADCMGDTKVSFTLSSAAAIAGTVTFYQGDTCNTIEKRDGEGTDCLELRGIPPITATLPDMSYENIDLSAFEICFERQEAPRNIWALIEGSPGTGEDVLTNYGTVALTADWSIPAAPTAVTGGSGSSAIPVTWTAGSVPGDHNGYRVYVDASGCTADGEAGMLGFTEGGTAPSGNADAEPAVGAVSATYNGGTSLMDGERADVAVTSVDDAGNESTLSNVSCITRVEVDGFCESRPGGCPQEACSISENNPSFTPLFLAFGACLLARRRRKA